MNPIKAAFNNVAWKRTLIICAAFGALSTIGNSKNLDSSAEAIGYFSGSTLGFTIMASAATASCSKKVII